MGVAPGLPVIPYRVTDTVVLASIDLRRHVAMAVRDAVLRQGAEVISISLGFPQLSIFQRHMGSAVDLAYESGVIVVGAAGQPVARVTFPGRFWRSIGVGGVRFDGRIYQTYDPSDHQYVDIWGPAAEVFLAETTRRSGRKVFRTGTSEDEETASGGTGSVIPSLSDVSASISNRGNGTSYATVHVSAAAALWWQHRGAEIEARYGQNRWQIVEAFRTLLKQTAHPIAAQRGAPTNGTGSLDIAALLDADLPQTSALQREDRLAAGQIF
jgi:subtilisin family serine protease